MGSKVWCIVICIAQPFFC